MTKYHLDEAKRYYSNSHFGNPQREVGNIVWVKRNDEKGLHEFPAEIVADDVELDKNGELIKRMRIKNEKNNS